MKIIPIHPDYITADLDDIRVAEYNRLKGSLDNLKEIGKLCGDDGRFIVAEFGFKGNVEEVIEQMEQHIQNVKRNGVTDSDRVPMQDAFMNACTQFANENDEYRERDSFRESMRCGDIDNMMDIVNRTCNRAVDMHNRKECLCYINR